MLRKIKKIMNVVSQPKLFKQLLLMATSGYLNEIGWIESFNKQLPVDKEGKPLPWVTYGFIDFISDKLNKNMDIFEYGSGNSTLWYAEKVNSVTSVEHNKIWYEKIKKNAPKNVTIYYQELIYNGEYSKSVNKTNRKFDIIIIDGRDRVNCIKNAINNLKESGIIILDDSERKQYKEGIDFLLNKEFKKIDFWGISPGLVYKKCTTIFYKPKNCLDI
jgi:Holliday junction resolvase-like predicted endonuclease